MAPEAEDPDAGEEEMDEAEPIDADELMLENMPLENVEDSWLDFVERIRNTDRTLAAHMKHAFFEDGTDFALGQIGLVFKKKLHVSAVSGAQDSQFFLEASRACFGDSAKLSVAYEPQFQESRPSIQMARRTALDKAHEALRNYAQNDDVVKKALSLFGGEIRSVERLS